MRNKIVLFHTTLRFQEDRSWKFVKYSRTRLISSGTETDNWQQVIRVKVGQKCRKKLFHRKFRFRKNKIWKLIKYVHTEQTLFPWKRCLKWTNIFAGRIIPCWWFTRIWSVTIEITYSNQIFKVSFLQNEVSNVKKCILYFRHIFSCRSLCSSIVLSVPGHPVYISRIDFYCIS